MTRLRKYLPWPRVVFATLALICLAAIAAPIVKIIVNSRRSPERVLLRYAAGEWRRIPEFDQLAGRVTVSPAGEVWVVRGGLRRLKFITGLSVLGTPAREFTAADFGTEVGLVSAGPVFDGADVWAAVDHSIVRYDGKRWNGYHKLARSERDLVTSICAAQGQVWAIWMSGRLSHFDGNRWKVSVVSASGLDWNRKYATHAGLARTPNGSLWLVRDGVWRFDGNAWANVTPHPTLTVESRLLGVAQDRVWIGGPDVWPVTMDGTQWSHYSRAEVPGAFAVAAESGSLYIAATPGVLKYDGRTWQRLPLPAPKPERTRDIAVTPDGALWTVAQTGTRGVFDIAWEFVTFALFALPCLLLVAALWIWWEDRRRRFLWEPARQLVLQITAKPQALHPDTKHTKQVAILLILSTVAILALTGRARSWTPALLATIPLAAHLACVIGESLKWHKRGPSDPIEPGGRRIDWVATLAALGASLLLFAFLNLDRFGVLPVLALLAGGCVTWFITWRIAQRAFNRADYSRALKWTGLDPNFHAAVLLFAGRLAEAEQVLREVFEPKRSAADRREALETLRLVLLYQNRDAEAQRVEQLQLELGAKQLLDPAATTEESRPRRALAHYRAGRKLLAAGDRTQAREHFVKAREADPEGLFGSLAAQAQ